MAAGIEGESPARACRGRAEGEFLPAWLGARRPMGVARGVGRGFVIVPLKKVADPVRPGPRWSGC